MCTWCWEHGKPPNYVGNNEHIKKRATEKIQIQSNQTFWLTSARARRIRFLVYCDAYKRIFFLQHPHAQRTSPCAGEKKVLTHEKEMNWARQLIWMGPGCDQVTGLTEKKPNGIWIIDSSESKRLITKKPFHFYFNLRWWSILITLSRLTNGFFPQQLALDEVSAWIYFDEDAGKNVFTMPKKAKKTLPFGRRSELKTLFSDWYA